MCFDAGGVFVYVFYGLVGFLHDSPIGLVKTKGNISDSSISTIGNLSIEIIRFLNYHLSYPFVVIKVEGRFVLESSYICVSVFGGWTGSHFDSQTFPLQIFQLFRDKLW